ncbi:twin transmembrane helix small protein [Xanthomonas translucens pv. translucens]|nr:twin transmembrane helix small protein [Xanthomonas translucens pv. translucens]
MHRDAHERLAETLLIVAFPAGHFWNLGAGLYYLLVDRGQSKRTVNALTWRIGLSVCLILLVILGIYSQAGADASTMASTVTAPLERHLGQIPGIDTMRSSSSEERPGIS